MKTLQQFGIYTAYSVQAAKPEQVWSLLKSAIRKSDKLFVNETIDEIGVPDYSTHIPYNSGFVEERFKYSLTKGIKDLLIEKCEGNHYAGFMLEHFCCDFYKARVLIASLNLVKGILTVNSDLIEFESDEAVTTVLETTPQQ